MDGLVCFFTFKSGLIPSPPRISIKEEVGYFYLMLCDKNIKIVYVACSYSSFMPKHLIILGINAQQLVQNVISTTIETNGHHAR